MKVHITKQGETLSKIAGMHSVSLVDLKGVNPKQQISNIPLPAGLKIVIPSAGQPHSGLVQRARVVDFNAENYTVSVQMLRNPGVTIPDVPILKQGYGSGGGMSASLDVDDHVLWVPTGDDTEGILGPGLVWASVNYGACNQGVEAVSGDYDYPTSVRQDDVWIALVKKTLIFHTPNHQIIFDGENCVLQFEATTALAITADEQIVMRAEKIFNIATQKEILLHHTEEDQRFLANIDDNVIQFESPKLTIFECTTRDIIFHDTVENIKIDVANSGFELNKDGIKFKFDGTFTCKATMLDLVADSGKEIKLAGGGGATWAPF